MAREISQADLISAWWNIIIQPDLWFGIVWTDPFPLVKSGTEKFLISRGRWYNWWFFPPGLTGQNYWTDLEGPWRPWDYLTVSGLQPVFLNQDGQRLVLFTPGFLQSGSESCDFTRLVVSSNNPLISMCWTLNNLIPHTQINIDVALCRTVTPEMDVQHVYMFTLSAVLLMNIY